MQELPNGYFKGKVGVGNMSAKRLKASSDASFEYHKETIEEILKLPCVAIPERGIRKETAEHFGIRTSFSEKTGKPDAIYFPYTFDKVVVGFKKRDLTLPKIHKAHFTTIGLQSVKCDMFGMTSGNVTGGKKIWITEGEFDCAVVWQTIKDKYPKSNPTVVSISNGTAGAVLNLGQKQNTAYLNKFNERIAVFDNDKATTIERERDGIIKGQDAVALVYNLIPDIRVAALPQDKDPCDMINDGLAEQLYWACMKPIEFIPDGFIKYEQFENKAKELPKLGKPWPWPTMTRISLGRRKGEGHYIGAGVKIGKSEFVNKLCEHIRLEENNKVALFKFEEEPEITCKKVAGKIFKKDFTNPEKIIFINDDGTECDIYGKDIPEEARGYFTEKELADAVDFVGDNIVYYNNYGACSWDAVKGAIRHAVLVEGVEDVVLDPISRMVQGMSASEVNQQLEVFADEISKMAKDLGFTYYCFCHLRAPETGKPHERGGKVLSHQFTGSRAMMRSCYYMWGIERNKDPDLPEKEVNTSTFVLLEDRKYGRSGYFNVFYDIETGDYIEPPEGFLESSCERLSEFKKLQSGDPASF